MRRRRLDRRALVLGLSIAAAGAAMVYIGPREESDQTAQGNALQVQTQSGGDQAVRELAGGTRTGLLNLYRVPAASFEELVTDRPNIAVVSVQRQLDDFWPDTRGGAEVLVSSRFVLRVEEVVSGDLKIGQEIVVSAPGGRVKTDGIPATGGSLRPTAGDQTVVLEFLDWPLFQVGTRELVFLATGVSESGETRWGAVPEGRYKVNGDKLQTIFPDGPPSNIVLPSDITSRIVGKSVADVRNEVRQTAAVP